MYNNDDFCNTDYDDENMYYLSENSKTFINERNYERYFLDIFEKYIDND